MTLEGLPARRAALDLLRAVLEQKRSLDESIEPLAALPSRDRAFARLLVATVLRRLGQLDALLAGALDRPLPRSAAAVRQVLRLGLVQLLFLDTPPHAAVATAVALAEAAGLRPFKGLVNAVLRRLGREGPDRLAAQDAARLNAPDWLWTSWTAAYGEAAARAIAGAHLAEPPLDLTVKADPQDRAALDDWAGRLDAVLLPTGTLRRPAGGAIAELPGFAEGAWWVQEAAAALPARLFGDLRGLCIADLCAAPGGKTAQLAAAGAAVIAVDRSAKRLERLQQNLGRLGLAAGTVVADAAVWRPEAPVDAVLLDAPCSATGTIRRHPDIARIKAPDDVAALAATQARLLAHAATLVRPGGLLVWCVCSLQPEEAEAQIDRLLASGAGAALRREPVRAAEAGGWAEILTPAGDIRSLPCHLAGIGGLDGFHVARLRATGG